MTTFYGIKPYKHQADVINETINQIGSDKIIVCNSSRQKGKSYMVSNILLHYAINYNNTKSFYVAPTLKQSKVLYKNIIDAIASSKIIKNRNSTELTINLINGSSIYFKSAEQRDSLRGETATGIICLDECAFISDEIFNIILPWKDVHKTPLLLTSTPFLKKGFFFKYFNYGKNKENNCITIDWSEDKYKDSIRQILSEEKLKEYEKIVPKNVFITDYLGKFLDDEASVFLDYIKCVKNNTITPTDKLYVGIDWGNGNRGDYTVISVFNDKGQQVYLDYFNDFYATTQLKKINAFIQKYKNQIKVIQSELNSIGTPYTDTLKEQNKGVNIIGFNTTNTSKNALVQNIQMAFEQQTITILNNEKQLNELSYYSCDFNPKTRTITYNAPQGLHDDTVMALMIAYDAYLNKKSSGKYSLSFK